MKHRIIFQTVSVLCTLGALSAQPSLAATCESLLGLQIADTTITAAQSIPAGNYTAMDGQTYFNLPAFCRVAGDIRPTSDSDIGFEIWLPSAGWNGRYQQVGNGGFAGFIPFGLISLGLQG